VVLDSGLRELTVLDTTLNDNGKMSEGDQHKLAMKILHEKVEIANSYIGNLDHNSPTYKNDVAKYLPTLTISAKRDICQITTELFMLLKNLVPLTIEDFLLQCKTELGIEFTKL